MTTAGATAPVGGSADREDHLGFSHGNPDASQSEYWVMLSELGDHLLDGERGPAGVKRIANLLHSVKWESLLILNYLWKCKTKRGSVCDLE